MILDLIHKFFLLIFFILSFLTGFLMFIDINKGEIEKELVYNIFLDLNNSPSFEGFKQNLTSLSIDEIKLGCSIYSNLLEDWQKEVCEGIDRGEVKTHEDIIYYLVKAYYEENIKPQFDDIINLIEEILPFLLFIQSILLLILIGFSFLLDKDIKIVHFALFLLFLIIFFIILNITMDNLEELLPKLLKVSPEQAKLLREFNNTLDFIKEVFITGIILSLLYSYVLVVLTYVGGLIRGGFSGILKKIKLF